MLNKKKIRIISIVIAAIMIGLAIMELLISYTYAEPLENEHQIKDDDVEDIDDWGYHDPNDTPYGNEPFYVHTPISAGPAYIDNDDDGDGKPDDTMDDGGHGTTQLYIENSNAQYELVLDNNYVIHWNNKKAGDTEETGKPYDRYTLNKYIKFPFEVYYNGRFYDLKPDTYGRNFTEWIKVKRPPSWYPEDGSPITEEHDITDDNWAQKVEDSDWTNTPFYIPSYAGEITDAIKNIYLRVDAINHKAKFDEEWEKEDPVLSDKIDNEDSNVTTVFYRFSCQLSGILYDFKITGADNANVFGNKDYIGKNETSFAAIKQEKRAGIHNRTTTIKKDLSIDSSKSTAIRYTLDGKIARNEEGYTGWYKNCTIPLTGGKSQTDYKNMGALWKGQTISYSFKTIANLWDTQENEDYTKVIPGFYYVKKDGTVLGREHPDDLKLFYKDDETGDYIEFNSNRDYKVYNTGYLGSPQFAGAYYDKSMKKEDELEYGKLSAVFSQYGDWVNYTDHMKNSELNDVDKTVGDKMFVNKKSKDPIRLYSGEFEELRKNLTEAREVGSEDESKLLWTYDKLNDHWATDNAYIKWNRDNDIKDEKLGGDKLKGYDRFRMSMQTWYGQFHIPEEIYVVDNKKYAEEHGGDFDIHRYMWGNDYESTYNNDKIMGSGIRSDDNIFEKGGYLVINFSIYTFKNVNPANITDENPLTPHLVYNGGKMIKKDETGKDIEIKNTRGDMWKKEGYQFEPIKGDPLYGIIDKITGEAFKYCEGDVAVVDLSRSTKDKYSPAIQNIN